jgi:hypothetical protein
MIPDILKPLYKQTADMMMGLQGANPLYGQAAWEGGGGYNPAEAGGGSKSLAEEAGGTGEPPVPGGGPPGGGGGGGYDPNMPPGIHARQDTGGPMTGGQYGFTAPGARRISDDSSFQDDAARRMMELMGNKRGGNFGQADARMNMQARRSDALWKNDPVAMREQRQGLRGASGAFEQARQAGQQRVTGESITGDPMLAAQQTAFENTAKPMLNNQFGAMGLGRSGALGGAMADAWAGQAVPLMQDAAGREERAIDRGMGADFRAAQSGLDINKGWQGYQNQWLQKKMAASGMDQNLANQRMAAGQQYFDMNTSMIDREFGMGSSFRGQEQEGFDAEYDDYLRRQGLAENALNTPFGQLGNTIGQRSSGGK